MVKSLCGGLVSFGGFLTYIGKSCLSNNKQTIHKAQHQIQLTEGTKRLDIVGLDGIEYRIIKSIPYFLKFSRWKDAFCGGDVISSAKTSVQ